MNHIDSKHIRIIRLVFIAYALHFLVGYLFIGLTQHNWHGTNQFQQVVALMVVLQLVYEVYAQIWLVKKSVWLATLISMAFILFQTYATIENTGVFHSPYIIVLLGILFLAGALGVYWPAGIGFVIVVRYLLIFTHAFTYNGGGATGGLIVVGFTAVDVVASILFWRRHYKFGENPELTEISKMLNSRSQQSEILIKSIADGVIVFDATGKINLLNPSAAVMTGWQPADALGIDINLVVTLARENGESLPEAENPLKQALEKKEPISKILQLSAQNKKKTTVSLIASPVLLPPDNTPVGVVAVFRDVTEQRKQEQQRADFISTASHEMRTPVAAIEGYLSLALNDKVANIDEKARDYLNKAHQSTEHLGKLFQDLLTSAKAEDGRLSNHPALVELGDYLDGLSQDLRFAAAKKKLGIEFVVGAGETINATQNPGNASHVVRPLYYVFVDPDRLREVITNLFDNAVKYTDEGKISISLTGDKDVVQFSVKDTGAGIPAEDIPHLFQKFYRVDNSATRTVGGTGLGLFICRKIVELYGGRIWVESELGKGSTFLINLPRLSNQQAEQYKTRQSTPEALSSVANSAS